MIPSQLAFASRLGSIRERMDVGYARGEAAVVARYQRPKFPLVPLGEVVTKLQYGSSARATAAPIGWPILRMNNLQDDGWDLSELKYVELPSAESANYRLDPGDVLVNRTNGSRDLVGKAEVFRESGHWLFASYLMRLRVDPSRIRPEFLSAFLNTKAGRLQVERSSRQILMSNINAAEVRALRIPLPPLEIQDALIRSLGRARRERDQALASADDLLAGLDSYLLRVLGLEAPTSMDAMTFAVRGSVLRGSRFDPSAHRPVWPRGGALSTPLTLLSEIADINSRRQIAPLADDTLVPYVGLPECAQTEIRHIVLRPYGEVRGRSLVATGDILFARIEPSVFNKKYILVDDLKGHAEVFTSGEFYVVTPRKVVPAYLYAMFFCSFVHAQVRGRTTGSSGRRRIDRSLFGRLLIPDPPPEIQHEIAGYVGGLRQGAKDLRVNAHALWEDAKLSFESFLLGTEADT